MGIELHPETKIHILTFHGVNSSNFWGRHFFEYLQKKYPELFEKNIWHFTPVDFGRLWAAAAWLPFFKNLIVQYTGRTLAYYQLKYPAARRVVIAHSYGSFAVVEALKIFRELAVDVLILTGSVAFEDTPWTSILETGGIGQVFNFVGGRDPIQFLAGLAGLGRAGKNGFKDLANGRVKNFTRRDFDHDDFLKNFSRFEKIILEDGNRGQRPV